MGQGWRDWEVRQEAVVGLQAGFSALQNQFGHKVKQVPNVGCCIIRGHQYRSQEKTWCWSAGAHPARSQGDNNGSTNTQTPLSQMSRLGHRTFGFPKFWLHYQ